MRRVLRWAGAVVGVSVVLAIILFAVVYVASERMLDRRYPFKPTAITVPSDAESIAEGHRLAETRSCLGGCHGPSGEGRVLFHDPMIGHVVAPNLMAAAARYSDGELAGMITTGVRPDGRSMVVMPSDAFRLLAEEDLGRIIAYLRSAPAAAGPGPDFWVGPMGRVGLVVGQLNTMAELVASAVPPPEATGAATAHGRYLAATICGHCHATNLSGAPAGPGTPATPPLQIVAAYSPETFTQLLRTGTALGDRQLGLMREVAVASLSKLTDEEIADLYAYLRALPAPAAAH